MQAPHFAGPDHPQHNLERTAERWLLRAFDAGIALTLFAMPLVMGGRHPAGRLVFVVVVLATAACWCALQAWGAARPWRVSAAEWLIAGCLLLLVLQLTPLPPAVHRALSPHTSEILPLWTASAGGGLKLGEWNTISLAPQETREGFLVFLAYAALFLCVSLRIASRADVERYLSWIAWAACGMAVLGIAQYLFGNGKFLWIYDHPFRGTGDHVQGSFANRNHFAHFLALGVGPLLWLVHRHLPTDRQTAGRRSGEGRKGSRNSGKGQGHVRPPSFRSRHSGVFQGGAVWSVGMLLVTLFGALVSLSRGGILAVACVMATCLALMAWKRLLDRRALLVAGSATAVLLAGLAIHGLGQVTGRLQSLTSLSGDASANMRLSIWNANLQAVTKFPLAGVGAGAQAEVYPLFLADDLLVEFTHTENGYLQVLCENGIAGLVLLLAAIALAVRWSWLALRGAEDSTGAAAVAAVVASLTASLLHGGVDFVWWIPACMTPTLLLLACLRFLSQAEPEARDVVERSATPTINGGWAAGALASTLLAFTAGSYLAGPALAAAPWERFLAMSLATKEFRPTATQHGLTAKWGKLDSESPDVVNTMAEQLEQALRHDPHNPRLNARMATVRLQQFNLAQLASDNPMSLAMIRDAALASEFDSLAAQRKWLKAALGERQRLLDEALRHALQAVHGAPLQGEVYAQLAELAFLQNRSGDITTSLVEQALRARPHSGSVLLAAGREAAIRGDRQAAETLLRQAFHQEREVQKQVIELLGPQTQVADFLSTFQPDLPALRMLRTHYQTHGRDQEALLIAGQIAAAAQANASLEEGLAAARLWVEASRMRHQRGELDAALVAARNAAQAAPLDYATREYLARSLMESEVYDQAAEQWQWCLSRRPADDKVRNQIAVARRLHLEAGVRRLDQAQRAAPRR